MHIALEKLVLTSNLSILKVRQSGYTTWNVFHMVWRNNLTPADKIDYHMQRVFKKIICLCDLIHSDNNGICVAIMFKAFPEAIVLEFEQLMEKTTFFGSLSNAMWGVTKWCINKLQTDIKLFIDLIRRYLQKLTVGQPRLNNIEWDEKPGWLGKFTHIMKYKSSWSPTGLLLH